MTKVIVDHRNSQVRHPDRTGLSNPDAAILLEINVKRAFSIRDLKDLLCTAFENRREWGCAIEGYVYPPGTTHKDFAEFGRLNNAEGSGREYYPSYEIVPLHKGGALKLIVEECLDKFKDEWGGRKGNGVHRMLLNLPKIQRGLQVLADKLPNVYTSIVNEEYDAGDADEFLQCCLFPDYVLEKGHAMFC